MEYAITSKTLTIGPIGSNFHCLKHEDRSSDTGPIAFWITSLALIFFKHFFSTGQGDNSEPRSI